MARKKVINKVIDYLVTNGSPANLGVIADFLNSELKYGVTAHELGNYLAKSPYIKRSGNEKHPGLNGYEYNISVWTLSEKGMEEYKRLNSSRKNLESRL